MIVRFASFTKQLISSIIIQYGKMRQIQLKKVVFCHDMEIYEKYTN